LAFAAVRVKQPLGRRALGTGLEGEPRAVQGKFPQAKSDENVGMGVDSSNVPSMRGGQSLDSHILFSISKIRLYSLGEIAESAGPIRRIGRGDWP
jgi:hypothetical protein